jgi:hypothetical protein
MRRTLATSWSLLVLMWLILYPYKVRKLHVWLEKIRKLDFYGAALAEDAAARLLACEELLDAYALRVFNARDENR